MKQDEIMFDLTSDQIKKLRKWQNKLPKVNESEFGMQGGAYSYIFTPIGIGTHELVRRNDGYELDLTEYNTW